MLRCMENDWWTKKARKLQRLADTKNMQKFYNSLKSVYEPAQHSVHPIKSKDGLAVIRGFEGIVSRWAEHFGDLLNCVNPVNLIFIKKFLPKLPAVAELDNPPVFDEVIWVLRSALNFASDGEVVREVGREFQRKGPEKAKADLAKECLTRVASAREQDMEIYEKRKGHEQLDEQQS
ncbi:hypothetical protein HELRODRAFT_158597 [Helobdella robusta]|uniref:Uncharacterized protein n=1 Tax=Helobdella robusta TaxID=6412 RepID=T1EN00_HELRO|nr:hypothetical protein HELRODRAFT_158597 [Helobdella robusta]ESO12147.1 hypothetical protein HELRODRAFT_158597 [Helobdella robusta]